MKFFRKSFPVGDQLKFDGYTQMSNPIEFKNACKTKLVLTWRQLFCLFVAFCREKKVKMTCIKK